MTVLIPIGIWFVGAWLTMTLMALRSTDPDWLECGLHSLFAWPLLLPWIVSTMIHDRWGK